MEGKDKKLNLYGGIIKNQTILGSEGGVVDEFDLAAKELKVSNKNCSDDDFSIRVVTPEEVENVKPEVLEYIMWLRDEHRLDDSDFESLMMMLSSFAEADLDVVKEIVQNRGLDKKRVIN